MSPFVVDANVMNYFQQERVLGNPGLAHAALTRVISDSTIALDSDGHCEREWLDCAGGTFPLALKDWIADMMVSGKIQMFNYNCGSMFQELNNIGVPKKDHKWIRLARSVPSTYIITEDIDLFDPSKKKNCNAVLKARIKAKCKGSVAKYLLKKYSIRVICCQHVDDAFANDIFSKSYGDGVPQSVFACAVGTPQNTMR